MGRTHLHISQATTPERLVIFFSGKGGGAKRWAHIVDAMPVALARVPAPHASSIERLDSDHLTLGRGAKLSMSPIALAYALAEWERCAEVAAGIASLEVLIEGTDLIPSSLLERARRRTVARGLPGVGDETAAADAAEDAR